MPRPERTKELPAYARMSVFNASGVLSQRSPDLLQNQTEGASHTVSQPVRLSIFEVVPRERQNIKEFIVMFQCFFISVYTERFSKNVRYAGTEKKWFYQKEA